MAENLREKAQELLRQNPLETPVLATVEVQKLFHELDVRQVELQRQNKNLRQAQHELSASRVKAEAALEKSNEDLATFNVQLDQLFEERSAALAEIETQFRETFNDLLVGVVVHAADASVLFSNPQANLLLGVSCEQIQGKQLIDSVWQFVHEDRSAMIVEEYPVSRAIATGKKSVNECFGIQQPGCADITWVTVSAMPVFTPEHVLDRIIVNFMDVTERKRLQEALEQRVLALTRPLDQPHGIAFDDLFGLEEFQQMQDEFSAATGVASMITDPDGTPITEPSNFTELCKYVLEKTEEVCADCFTSRTVITRPLPHGPIIRQSSRSGLWDAGASISIGGRHVANWLIGQVRDEFLTEEQMRAYAREIGADETAVVKAFERVPVMPYEHFADIAQALFTLANHLSTSAYQNVQQARFIADQKRVEQALQESEEKYRKLFESESNGIVIFDGQTRQFIDVNDAALQLHGYSRAEFLQLTHDAITSEPAEVVKKALLEVVAGATLSTIKGEHRMKDGTVFPVEVTACSYSLRGRQVVCSVIRDITEQVALEGERENNRKELRKLSSEVSMAEQRERERIGGDLHDGISQLLSSSLLRLQVLKDSPLPEVAVASLDIICGIVKEALDGTRDLTFELSCPMLSELGLAAALDELCSDMSHEYGIRFEFNGDIQKLTLPMDRKIALYRSTRELLINVMKHAEARWACVQLERKDDCLRICVEDDGKGFDAAMAGKGFSRTGGFGLFNIREYIRHAGGNLEIESIPGDGTHVTISLPITGAA